MATTEGPKRDAGTDGGDRTAPVPANLSLTIEETTTSSIPVVEQEHELVQLMIEGQRQQEKALSREVPAKLDKVLFAVTGVLALAFIAWGFFGTDNLSTVSQSALDWVITNAGWFFVLLASFLVVYVIWLAVGRFGRIPLGQDGEEPQFKTVSWIAMMFSAGMGIGLMFYGVAEPLFYYVSPPPGTVDAQTAEALQTPWAPRCSTGACIRGPCTPSWALPWPTAPTGWAGAS